MRSNILIGSVLAIGLSLPAAYAQNTAPAEKTDTKPATQLKHSGEWRSSKLIGLNIYNAQNEKIGDINEVLITSAGNVAGVVIGVGGFLGMGEHDVLVKMDQLKFVNQPVGNANTARTEQTKTTGSAPSDKVAAEKNKAADRAVRNANEKWYPEHAVMNATKEQLKAMPEFKYSNYN